MNNQISEILTAGLTEEQRQAVTVAASGRLRISAGAGSGKTEVLTRRIAALLEQGVRADEIVAITYTTKAAAEMKARLVEKRKLSPARLRDMEVATFHSFLSRFLRQDPFGAGLDRSDAVIAENNRRLIADELVEKFAGIFGEQIIDGPEALGAAAAMKLVEEFPAALSKIRRYLLKPAEFYNLARQLFNSRPHGATVLELRCLEWIYRFYSCYLEEFEKRGLLDFDEILIRGRNLVRDLRESGVVPQRRVFLIDEFQDNNPDQLQIVNLFCADRDSHICVVGDEKQSIYRFQGADIETFRHFKGDNDIVLRDNFRSYREIIEVADSFLEAGGQCGSMFVRQTARRGSSPRTPAVSCLLTPDEFTDAQACEQIAEMIDTLVKSGMRLHDRRTGQNRAVGYGDIAVIVSSIRGLPRAFEDALSARQIPYLMSGGFSFYARSEIDEILAFLRLLVQPNDDYSVVKILTGPLYGLKDSELAELSSAGRHDGVALLPHILALPEEKLPAKAAQFRLLYVMLKERSSRPGLLDLCHTVLEQAGFFEYAAAQKLELRRRRMENNLGKFIGIVRNFEQNGVFTSLHDFLLYIERILMADIDEDEAGLGLEEGDAIKVMTIHKSKGLEFPVVICPFLRRRAYRATSRIYFDRRHGLIVNDPTLPVSKGASPALADYIAEDRLAAEGEDRRKLYVAFTRAEDLLIIQGKNLHSQPPAKETEPAEPMYEVCRIIGEQPDLGCVAALPEWPQLLEKWLAAGHEPPVEKILRPPAAPDPVELEKDLRAIVAFIQQKPSAGPITAHGQDIFSLQDLQMFKACPRRYFFVSRHIASFAEKPVTLSSITGTMVHETIRLFHSSGGHGFSDRQAAMALVEKLLDSLAPFYGEEGAQVREAVRAIIIRYLGSELAVKEPWLVEAEVNVKFDAPEGAYFVRGFADRVDWCAGEVSIVDFKTRRFSPEAHEGYKNQLALYRIAATRGILGEAGCLNFASSSIAYLTAEEFRLVEIEPDLPAFERYVDETVRAIRTETAWQPSAGSDCEDCGFAILCHGAIEKRPDTKSADLI
ncbi:MAG TPA: ATP-dependent DNA helicase [Candidatus Rifleibacterium sp.]|nr:ATP-dependent DNA helicase [Candidatus Rifleibacterium sp.]HPT45696.1 ATP-dependent DNA helicase [Candidatus Rifleibacterium sp.]